MARIRPSGRLGAGEDGADLAAEARRDGRRSRQEMRIAVGRRGGSTGEDVRSARGLALYALREAQHV